MKASTTGVFFHVPKAFDLARWPELSGKPDKAHWLLNRIITLTNCYRHEQGEHFQNISRQTMETFMHSSEVTAVKRALMGDDTREAVIECDGHYVPARYSRDGGKSMGYRLAAGVIEGGFTKVPCKTRAMARKILKYRIIKNQRPLEEHELDSVGQYLYGWLKRLRIDHERAFEIIDGLGENYSTELGTKAACKLTVEQMVEQQEQEKPEGIFCPFGRLHTCVTRLVTEARSCLTVDGQKLVNIDITNSQLVFFSMLMLESFWGRGSSDGFNWSSSSRVLSSVPSSSTSSSTPARGRSSARTLLPATPLSLRTANRNKSTKRAKPNGRPDYPNMTGMPEDAQEFVRQVIDGIVYDRLMDDVGFYNRKVFKGEFFRDVLYGDPKAGYAKVSNLRRAFGRKFPTVLDYIDYCKLGSEPDSYKRLPQQMQIKESQFVLGAVCLRLATHHAEIPAITIHDSIMTTPEHVETVRRVMADEFTRIGVRPAMRVGG